MQFQALQPYVGLEARTQGAFCPVSVDQILADDNYGIVWGTFRAERDGRILEFAGMGVWRFDASGRAVEHWEINPPGDGRDQFFVEGEPDFRGGDAREFWTEH